MQKIKVLLADDHSIVRDGLKALLDEDPIVDIVGEAANGKQVITFCEEHKPNVILMDINMPEMNGIEATRAVVSSFPDVRVLVMSMFGDQKFISEALEAGAMGYMMKNVGKDALIEGIQTVHEGKSYFTRDVSEIMMAKYMKSSSVKSPDNLVYNVADLTRREKEIIKLVADEMTNLVIGDKLFISSRTVETHRRNILKKLGIKNTAGLIKFAVENNLLE